jgi:murein DD-endopeptidase MepM/ murein hydrolase activator NlpD
LRKRFYILFVTRDAEGELRKIPIPLHYLYVFIAGALIGMLSITGMAGSYTRMLLKVTRFNQLRTEKEALKTRYTQLEQVAKEKDIQVASLGSLASDVSALYGLKSEPILKQDTKGDSNAKIEVSLDQLHALRSTAMSGVATIGIGMGLTSRSSSLMDWMRMAQTPNLWPVVGRITGAFGEREDPFNGEGAFHRGIDISAEYGTPVRAPADGVVTFVGLESGYGRLIQIEHAQEISTRYGHLSAFAVTERQHVTRGQVIGYVGTSGRSTGPHLHYEVWVHNSPVNPYKFLRITPTLSASVSSVGGAS